MECVKPGKPQRGFFDLPAEIRLIIYETYCNVLRKEMLNGSHGPCNHRRACRRRSHADVMHVTEFAYRQSPYDRATDHQRAQANPGYDLFVDMKLVSRQMRAEFMPVWLSHWVFQLPRPTDPLGLDLYPNEDDPVSFPQMKALVNTIGCVESKHVKHIRVSRHLKAQLDPEQAVQRETGHELVRMLDSPGDFHEQLSIHVQIRCSDVWPSNRRASRDVVVKQRGSGWVCVCEGPVTTTFERGWF